MTLLLTISNGIINIKKSSIDSKNKIKKVILIIKIIENISFKDLNTKI